jgi:hypothetical protein
MCNTFNSKRDILAILHGLSTAVLCYYFISLFLFKLSLWYTKNIAKCRASFQFIWNELVSSVVLPYTFCSMSQEYQTSSCECEFIFGHYCLHFTTTENHILTYYYSHIFLKFWASEHFIRPVILRNFSLHIYVFFIFVWCLKVTQGTNWF